MSTTIQNTEFMSLLDANFGAIFLKLNLVNGRTIYSNTGGNRLDGGLSKQYQIYSTPKLINHIESALHQMENNQLNEKQLSNLTSASVLHDLLQCLKTFEGQVITIHRDADFDIDAYRLTHGFLKNEEVNSLGIESEEVRNYYKDYHSFSPKKPSLSTKIHYYLSNIFNNKCCHVKS